MESKLAYTFRDPSLLELSLTHASWGHEKKTRLPHNERLEFLGDSVLQLVISEHLYRRFPDIPEGQLTKIRAHLVNRAALVKMAKNLDLGAHLKLGHAEAAQGGRERSSNLANAMEAVIGAMFLDGGFDAARDLILSNSEETLKSLHDNPEPDNTKGILQERLHKEGKQAIYQILSETGPAHQKHFHASVEVDGIMIGEGRGSTKKEAETHAARAALASLQSS